MAAAGDTIGDNRLFMGKRQYQWQPAVHRMAALTQLRGLRMAGTFAGNTAGRAVVTAGTGAGLAGYLAVIETHLQPVAHTGMTGITGLNCGHMVGPFACSNEVVVATGARGAGLVVSERDDEIVPARARGVAQLAGVGGNRMGRGFIAGDGADVTGHAGIAGLLVWKRH